MGQPAPGLCRGIRTALVAIIASCAVWSGCAQSEERAERDSLTARVGVYPPAPPGIATVRVGVPPFSVSGEGTSAGMAAVAADQLGTLAFNTHRFDVVEREQLDQLLKEQQLEGVVQAGELARPGRIRGVDYLFIGKITNLRLKAERSSGGLGIGNVRLPKLGGIGAFDFRKKSSKVVAECGVDLRLVDPTSGVRIASHFGEFRRTDSIGAFGIEVLGVGASSDADLRIDEDSQGKILRLALDEALRKMLPDIDLRLQRRAHEESARAAAGGEPPTAAPDADAKPSFCSQCGAKLPASAKFCGSCGAAVGQ